MKSKKRGFKVKAAGQKSRLIELTESFMTVGRFDLQAQTEFSVQFHRSYYSADLPDRIAVSKMLCRSPSIPHDVIALLCCDDERVAAPILSNTPLLTKADLTTQILQGTAKERETIARRKDLSAMLVSHLISFGEKPVAQAILDNLENLPNISDKLAERIQTLAGDIRPQAGNKSMNGEDNKLDALVSSMEEDWAAHYQPDAAEARQSAPVQEPAFTSTELQTELVSTPSPHETEITGTEANAAPPISEENSFLDESDFALLEKLGGTDWDLLDDDAIEALAKTLAEENIKAQLDDTTDPDLSQSTGSFVIAANDANNAPIPPLEVTQNGVRSARILFKGDPETEAATPADDVSQIPVPSVPLEETVQIAQTPAEPEKSEAISGTATIEERKPQIRLSIRKTADQHSLSSSSSSAAASKASVELSSATEDDWLAALEHLSKEAPELAVTRSPSPLNSEPIATPLAQRPATAAQAHSSSVAAIEKDLEIEANQAEVKPQVTIRLNKAPSIAPVQAPVATAASTELAAPSETKAPIGDNHDQDPIREHAPMGLMPNMISFEDLDLVEAEPDLPSATELLLAQSNRAAPSVELIEPVELSFLENGQVVSVDDIADAQMRIVAEQLEQQRRAQATKIQDSLAVKDLTEQPEMRAHRVVEAEEYAQLRAAEAPAQPQTAPVTPLSQGSQTASISLQSIEGFGEAAAQTFYKYDDETRLTLLQTIMSQTLVDADQLVEDRRNRTLLDEETAADLVMARFGNDRIHVAEMLHDISGHRRLDLSELLQDQGGEALVTYLYHIGMDESGTLSMVLHGPDAVSHSYAKVAQLMTLYHQLYPAAAKKIVEGLFGESQAIRPVHQPIHEAGAGAASPRLRQSGLGGSTSPANRPAPVFGRRGAGGE